MIPTLPLRYPPHGGAEIVDGWEAVLQFQDFLDNQALRSRREAIHKLSTTMMEERMSKLAEKSCIPCRGGVPPLTGQEIQPLLAQLDGWEVVDGHHLEKSYRFPDFATALEFVNKVGAIAEEEGHHPDLTLSWGRVGIRIWTHKIDGLTESDFILAAKCDAVDGGAGDR